MSGPAFLRTGMHRHYRAVAQPDDDEVRMAFSMLAHRLALSGGREEVSGAAGGRLGPPAAGFITVLGEA